MNPEMTPELRRALHKARDLYQQALTKGWGYNKLRDEHLAYGLVHYLNKFHSTSVSREYHFLRRPAPALKLPNFNVNLAAFEKTIPDEWLLPMIAFLDDLRTVDQ